MRKLTGHLRDEEGFTLIELIVVIAVLAILVLLATPRFLGHTQTAKLRRIQHDIKVVEGMVAEHLINYGNIDDWDGPVFNLETETLYNTKGLVNEDNLYEPGTYYVVSDKILNNSRTKLKGSFYANNGGSVYYSETKLTGGPLSDDEIDYLIENLNYIPVANATELAQINGSGYDEDGLVIYEELTWGAGTRWETKTTGKLDSSYIQVQDIDLAHIDEWTPIGVDYAYPFSGDYNGGNYVISNLKITEDNSSENSGLFGTVNVNKDIVIKSISLNNANIVGNDRYSGLLIGYIGGDGSSNLTVETININNSSVTNLNGQAGTIGFNTGGLSRVSNVNVNAEIRASEMAAGLLSYNVGSQPLDIENIIINGVVESSAVGSSYGAGGIIGYNAGNVERIENMSIGSDVQSYSSSGGVIGRNVSSGNDNLVINNVNVNGNITSLSNEYASAIIGFNLSEMKEIKNITINSNIKSEGFAAGLIARNIASKPFDVDNVTFNGSVVAVNRAGGLIGESPRMLGNVSNIEIIADVTSESEEAGGLFGGTFTSAGNIKNVYFEGNITAEESAGGLIANNTAKLGNITNIEIISDIHSNSSEAGGLIGNSHSGNGNKNIDNISFIGDISAEKNVGGLIGRNTSVLGSISNVDIKSKMISRNKSDNAVRDSNAGGLMGQSHSGGLSNMSNINIEGEIIGHVYVGGLIGHASNPTSYDNINIEAKMVAERSDSIENFIGGLVGYNVGSNPITMSDINIQGEILGGYNTGGLFGFNFSTIEQIDRLSMDVKLSNGHYVGSLIAQDRSSGSSIILNSHISGEIISSDIDGSVGGLYGFMSSNVNKKLTIKDTTVSVTQKDTSKYAGGIVGELIDKLLLDFDNLEIVSLLKGDKLGQFIGLYSDYDELDSTFFDFSGTTFSGSGASSEIGEELQLIRD